MRLHVAILVVLAAALFALWVASHADSAPIAAGPSSGTVIGGKGGASDSPPLVVLGGTLAPSTPEGANAGSTNITIANGGGGSLAYSLTCDRSWCAPNPTSGTSTGESDTIAVQYVGSDALSSSGSPYDFVVTGQMAGVHLATLAGTLRVTDEPELEILSQEAVSAEIAEGGYGAYPKWSYRNVGGTACTTFTMAATETADCDAGAGGTLNWIEALESTGTLNPGETALVDLILDSPMDCDPGVWTATVRATCTGATNSPLDATFTLTVPAVDAPVITIEVVPTALSTSATAGNDAPSVTFDVDNIGAAGSASASVMTWTVSDAESWTGDVTCTRTTGNGTITIGVGQQASDGAETVTCTFDTDQLAAGSYPFTATITAAGATNTPVVLNGTVTINPVVTGGCTDGVDCLCDTLPSLYPQIVMCEDGEHPNLRQPTGRAEWNNLYPGIDNNCLTDPPGPNDSYVQFGRDYACAGVRNYDGDCDCLDTYNEASTAWGTPACEVAGETDCTFSGNVSLGFRMNPNRNGGFMGTKFLNNVGPTFGMVQAVKWSSNYVLQGPAHKMNELDDNDFPFFGTSNSNCPACLNHPWAGSMVGLGAGGSPTATLGAFLEIASGSLKFSAVAGQGYTWGSTHTVGEWICLRGQITGFGTATGRIEQWVAKVGTGETKVVDISGIDMNNTAGYADGTVDDFSWNNYYNGPGSGTGWPFSTPAIRWEDNVIITDGTPPPCSAIGF